MVRYTTEILLAWPDGVKLIAPVRTKRPSARRMAGSAELRCRQDGAASVGRDGAYQVGSRKGGSAPAGACAPGSLASAQRSAS